MRKISFLSFLVFLFFLAFAFSVAAQETGREMSNYNATFTLVGSTAIVEETLTFTSPQQNVSWPLPEDAEAVEIVQGSQVPFTSITFKYITESLVEKTKDRFFLVDLSKVTAPKISVTVKLSEGATLKYPLNTPEAPLQTSLVPKTSKVSTDGKSIIIQWDEKDLQPGKTLVVIYQEHQKLMASNLWLGIAGIVVVVAVIAGIIFLKKNKRRNKEKITGNTEAVKTKKEIHQSFKENLTRNLFEEERAIMEVLLEAKDHELWQKQLSLKTGISAVKLSRKLRNMEAKGLIEKIPYGNTNKIRIKRKGEDG